MGRLLLQMMMTVDGKVSGPNGELDWIASDDTLEGYVLGHLRQAERVVLGAGDGPEMGPYWASAENDPKLRPIIRDLGRGMNEARKIIYSHRERRVDWRNTEVRVIADDAAFVADLQRVKREVSGLVISYGGVRFARSLLQHGLVDELLLHVCPLVLGAGKLLFTDETSRRSYRLRESARYASGAVTLHYDAAT